MNSPALSVLVVGYGAIGRRHATVARELAAVSSISVVDPSISARELAESHGFRSYSSLSEALNDRPDLCVIASPNGLHIEHAEAALRVGSHVLIEKPLGLDSAAALQLTAMADASSRLACVVLQNRLSPAAAWIKALLEQGQLGTPLLIEVSCLWNRDERYYSGSAWRGDNQLDGGVLFTQFSHFIDLIIWLCGPMQIEAAYLRNFTHPTLSIPDTGTLQFTLAGGALGTLSFTTSAWQQNAASSLTLLGTQGTVRLGGQYVDRIEYAHISGIQIPELRPITTPADGHRAVWSAVVEAILAGPPYPAALTSTLTDAVEVISTIERIHSLGTQPSGTTSASLKTSEHA